MNVFVTAAAVLLDPSLQVLAWIGVVDIVAIFGVTMAYSKPKAAHDGHGHGDAHGTPMATPTDTTSGTGHALPDRRTAPPTPARACTSPRSSGPSGS